MKIIRFLLFFVLIVQNSLAQDSKENYSSELFVTVVEHTMYPYIRQVKYEFVPNIGYIHYFGKWNVSLQAGFISHSVESGCKTCPDAFYGKLHEVDFRLKSAVNRKLVSFANSKFECWGGLGIYLKKSELTGYLMGGFNGAGRIENTVYTEYGVRPQLMLSYFPLKRLSLTFLLGQRYGIVKAYDKTYDYTGKLHEHTWLDPEFRVGFRF